MEHRLFEHIKIDKLCKEFLAFKETKNLVLCLQESPTFPYGTG
jgi:hypothetical protein